MKILLIILGILFLLFVLYLYIVYKLMTFSAVILRSAGKMQTGNDLGEQVEDTLENEKIPNFFQFYWILYKRIKDYDKQFEKIRKEEK